MGVVTHTYRFSGAGEDFGPRADGMVTLHTWESHATANRVADMMPNLRWQDGDSVAGSYNRVVCVDGVISAVPDHHASGGINPGSPSWSPKVWLYSVLGRDQIANPNYFTLNIAAAGQRAYYDTNGWPAGIIDGMARSIIEEEQRIGRPVVITNHADFQTNRSDAGAIATELVKARIAQLKAGTSVADIDTFILETIRIDAAANIRSAPADSASLLFRTGSASTALSIGTKNGYHAYWIKDRAAWGYTSTQHNVLAREPYQNTVEVIKEVPTGITQQQLLDASAAGFSAAKSKARVAVEGIAP